ncbi:hypothetical protein BAUCODRAFT_24702 [Baudoinia panamericana UAMH 10762]|uniref:Uncharacterized protein n=1 Tax=Baudoinia panamericana (strain UAMH 10762) TaxID=717646 RepID=M2LMW6_BAUPA|nr:uncharacterized protein BAUCODRAFT_24702 [Baudoinia panamericana UAMH 10762]EMC95677.1 hypothetical protein BAUCODRAFT_24702 [Baudoinia panamericana UAMH 10762]
MASIATSEHIKGNAAELTYEAINVNPQGDVTGVEYGDLSTTTIDAIGMDEAGQSLTLRQRVIPAVRDSAHGSGSATAIVVEGVKVNPKGNVSEIDLVGLRTVSITADSDDDPSKQAPDLSRLPDERTTAEDDGQQTTITDAYANGHTTSLVTSVSSLAKRTSAPTPVSDEPNVVDPIIFGPGPVLHPRRHPRDLILPAKHTPFAQDFLPNFVPLSTGNKEELDSNTVYDIPHDTDGSPIGARTPQHETDPMQDPSVAAKETLGPNTEEAADKQIAAPETLPITAKRTVTATHTTRVTATSDPLVTIITVLSTSTSFTFNPLATPAALPRLVADKAVLPHTYDECIYDDRARNWKCKKHHGNHDVYTLRNCYFHHIRRVYTCDGWVA